MDIDSGVDNGGQGSGEAIVRLLIYQANPSARCLCKRPGFRELEFSNRSTREDEPPGVLPEVS